MVAVINDQCPAALRSALLQQCHNEAAAPNALLGEGCAVMWALAIQTFPDFTASSATHTVKGTYVTGASLAQDRGWQKQSLCVQRLQSHRNSCKAILRLQNWVTEQGHLLYISLCANSAALGSSWSYSFKDEHEGSSQELCLSCADWASELTTALAINSCSSSIKVRLSRTHSLCINLEGASRAHSRVFLLWFAQRS